MQMYSFQGGLDAYNQFNPLPKLFNKRKVILAKNYFSQFENKSKSGGGIVRSTKYILGYCRKFIFYSWVDYLIEQIVSMHEARFKKKYIFLSIFSQNIKQLITYVIKILLFYLVNSLKSRIRLSQLLNLG